MNADRDVIGGMLQAMEHVLEGVDSVSIAAGQLINAQKGGKPLSLTTLAHYEDQLAELDRQRAHLRGVIATWWSMLEGRQ